MAKIDQLDFKTEKFEGPLDLLLHLIEKNQFNIFDIPMTEITAQYLAYLDRMQEEDMELTSDFLVMAATLISIKSRMLLPKEQSEEEEEEDPRSELVQRLLEYKVYQYASGELKDMEISSENVYFKNPSIPEDVEKYEEPVDPVHLVKESGLTIGKLQEIFETLLKREINRADPVRSRFGTIKKEEITVDEKMSEIRSSIRGLKSIHFNTLITGRRTRLNVIVTFLAILELMKSGSILIRQKEQFGDILIDSLEG